MNDVKYPDPQGHLMVSLTKSVVRLLAGMAFIFGSLWMGGLLIILAEILGIWEELV